MVKGSEFKSMSVEDIQAKARELEASLFNLKFQSSLGKLENTSEIRLARRELARAKTILNEKRPGFAEKESEAVKA